MRRVALALGLVTLAWLGGASPASGATVTSGTTDATGPLVIDPSGTGRTDQVGTNWGYPIIFIQRMPVTKEVTQITLGDLGRDDACPDSPDAKLIIKEHPTGAADTNASQTIAESTSRVTLPSTPGRVTWDVGRVKLVEGRGYSIWVQNFLNACTTTKVVAWPHNGSDVNNGGLRCDAVSGSDVYRMWHKGGESDAVTCPPWSNDTPSGFDPDMPSGWLSVGVSGDNYVETVLPWQPCQWQDFGAHPLDYRAWPTAPQFRESVCVFSGFAPFGSVAGFEDPRPPDGWYYAYGNHPLAGGWRDVYVKLEARDYDALLEQNMPVLKYDSDEEFQPLSPAAMTDFWTDVPDLATNELRDSSGAGGLLATSNPFLAGPWVSDPAQLSLSYLQPVYPLETSGEQKRRSGTPAAGGDYLSARGDAGDGLYDDDSRAMAAKPGYPYRVYGRAAYGSDGRLWLQYYVFYYFNAAPVGGIIGNHEGDWEMVQYRLDGNDAIDMAAYAEHNDGQKCDAASLETTGGRPLVYVARGSHASYFGASRIPLIHAYDRADGATEVYGTLDEIDSTTPSWAAWPGAWGDSGASPSGPQFQPGEKWTDPSVWAAPLETCSDP